MNRQIGTALLALAALTFAAPASAQTTIAGGLRLHLETDVLGIATENPDEGESSTNTTIGPGSNGLGFGIGYGITEQLILGGNFVLQHRDGEGDNDGEFRLSLLPYLEFMLGEGSVRPFVGGVLIFALTSRENFSATSFGLGGLGGVHIFLTDSFSLDVSGRLYFTANNTSRETGMGDVDSSSTTVGLLVLVGVSGWGI